MMNQYRNAIASIESAGSGDYAAVGPTHPRLGRALGRYQVMEANIGPWSREALGREVTPDEFINNPQIQDAIFDSKFGGYVNQYGPEGAAQAWFAGPGGVGKTTRQDSLGTNVGQYAQKFRNALGAGQGGGQMTPNNRQPQPGTPRVSTQGQAPQQAAQSRGEPVGGFIGKMFPNATREDLDRVSMALMSMSGHPTPGMQQMMGNISQRQGERRKEGRAAQQRNKTADWLRSNGMPQLADGVETGSITAKDALVMARQQPKDDRTALMKNAEWIMGQNPDMTFDEALQAARSGGVNVNVGAGEGAFQKETGKIIAQEAAEVVQQGLQAQRSMGQLQTLEQALSNAPSGAAGAWTNTAANLGLKLDGASDVEVANAIISQLVPAQRPPGSGDMSDVDLEMFRQSLPRLINTREGNKRIIETMRGISEYDMKRGEIARQLQLGQITPQQAAQAYQELGNPLEGFRDTVPSARQPSGGSGADGDDLSPEERRYLGLE